MSEFIKITDPGTQWGELYLPARPKENEGNGLRVVLFVSCNCGIITLNNLLEYERRHPERLNITGVVTDDPVDPAARITLHKRVWHFYTPEERAGLKNNMIDACMAGGVACYTGSVKTDFFRDMYRRWDPETLIMFCFGQWLDPFLFNYPVMGSYNLHPSDLPKKIGAGTQPFQNAITNGSKTAPLVIHQITELIDMGPVVGISSPVSILLPDGSYPASILTLLEKITSPGGWMCVQLVEEIYRKKRAGEQGPVSWIDFESVLTEEIKQLLMSPATNDLKEMYTVPSHPLLTA